MKKKIKWKKSIFEEEKNQQQRYRNKKSSLDFSRDKKMLKRRK